MNNYKPESEKRKKKKGKTKKKRNSPEFSRADDLRASSNSFSLLVAIAASSVFLWRTCMRKVRWLAIIWISVTYLIHTCTTNKKKRGESWQFWQKQTYSVSASILFLTLLSARLYCFIVFLIFHLFRKYQDIPKDKWKVVFILHASRQKDYDTSMST